MPNEKKLLCWPSLWTELEILHNLINKLVLGLPAKSICRYFCTAATSVLHENKKDNDEKLLQAVICQLLEYFGQLTFPACYVILKWCNF